MDSNNPYLGIGLYSIPEAARLLRTPARTVYNWAQGYSFQHQGQRRQSAPLLDRDMPELIEQRILTFVDLVELQMVRLFRIHRVSMRTIKDAARRLAEKHNTNHPFAVRDLETDGKRIFDEDFEEIGAYQFVIEVAAKPFFKQIEFKDNLAFQIWPHPSRRIVLDPRRNFGKPITTERAVPTFMLYQMRRAGESPERIADWYRVPVEAVNDAVEYETQLAA